MVPGRDPGIHLDGDLRPLHEGEVIPECPHETG
jgi:hypothetical protein